MWRNLSCGENVHMTNWGKILHMTDCHEKCEENLWRNNVYKQFMVFCCILRYFVAKYFWDLRCFVAICVLKINKRTSAVCIFLTLVGRRTSSADMLSQCGTCSEMIESSQQIIISIQF